MPIQTEVMLTYDWSRVPPHHRDIKFPPFGRQHLDNSVNYLALKGRVCSVLR